MSQLEPFHFVYEDLNVFRRNLSKDNAERRLDLKVVRKNFAKLELIKNEFHIATEEFNKDNHEPEIVLKARKYIDNIASKILSIEEALQERLNNINPSDISVQSNNMTEKFDLRTAASLLPVMNNREEVTKQLIDAIELYDALLDDAGKKLLTTYVLKTRLSQSAKLRLNENYTDNKALITDIRRFCLAQKSATSLSFKLTTAKQLGKSIEDFGRSLEEMFLDLTITQAQGVTANVQILKEVNEKLAVNAFANGLNNQDLRTIIKARNYSNLADAIQGAKDENIRSDSQNVFHVRGRGFSRNVNRGFYNKGNQRGRNSYVTSNNYNGNGTWQNSHYRNNNNTQASLGQRRGRGTHHRGNPNYYRGNRTNERNLVMNVDLEKRKKEDTFFRE